MTKYLISFPAAAIDVSAEDFPIVVAESHAVIEQMKAAGVYVFGGGIDETFPPVMVDGDGTVTEGTYPQTKQLEGGYAVLELPSREAALEWARIQIEALAATADELQGALPESVGAAIRQGVREEALPRDRQRFPGRVGNSTATESIGEDADLIHVRG